MQRLHRVGRIHHPPHLRRKIEERSHSIPILLPQLANRLVAIAPLRDELTQLLRRLALAGRAIDRFQISRYLLALFPAHVVQAGAHQMHDQSCTLASGYTASTACGNPLSPSMQTISTSLTPRFFSSVNTASQNFAPSLLFVHKPSTSFRPSRSTPMATYTARFSTRPSCRIFTYNASRNNSP